MARRNPPAEHDERLTAHDDAHADDGRSTIHALAHAHASAHASVIPLPHSGFPHEKLDAYRIALQMASIAKRVASDIPRGHRSIADHLLRATSNTVLLLAEGANRRGPKEKRQRFVESRGECAEAAAACDLIMVLDLAPEAELTELKQLAGRVSAMLTRLIQRLS